MHRRRFPDCAGIKRNPYHPHVSPPELLAAVRGLGLGGFHATHSGAAFVEVAAEGLTKAAGLALLCGKLGVAQADTLAFGDAPNDAEMLAWAGRGVAMESAHPEARAAADEVTLSNEEDGVAVVVERVLAELA
ncbi:HAD family hydrolase [Deinococcus wulumuqiensis]|uniref:HAD family hydrolase n=1 Tax=Deinococcus wulumuqiensis TaxID=980427 RepID=UPI0026AE12BB